MMKIILIAAAQTDWRIQGRLAGDINLPLNEFGHRQAVSVGVEIAKHSPAVVRCGPEQATKQTAALIAHEVNIRQRTVKDLREMHLGIWQGLMLDDLGDRFGKVYRQWRSDPLSIEPPEGETVSAVAERLLHTIAGMRKKHANETVAIVVGQYAYAVLHCRLIDHSFEKFWEYVDAPQAHELIEIPAGPLSGVP